jgi:hypothetical protein
MVEVTECFWQFKVVLLVFWMDFLRCFSCYAACSCAEAAANSVE